MLDAQSAAPVQASVSPALRSAEVPPPRPKAARLIAAAKALSPVLAAGHALDARTLREAMTRAFEGSDAAGAWAWKDAYEAAEAAVVLFVKRYGRAMRREAGSPARMLAMLDAVAALEPSHTRRSEEQVAMQQFSTPLPLAYAALQAAAVRPGDVVLEPSAGTGMLAVLAECALGSKAEGALHLNELSTTRAGLLEALFPGASVTRCNAESIADHLPFVRPTVVLMNPPFSVSPGVARRRHDADLNHLRSACAMLPPGGRLAAVTSAHCVPGDRAWVRAFERMDPPARVAFSVAIDGRAYARRGTSFHSRLTVLDRDPEGRAGVPVDARAFVADAGSLLAAIAAKVPARLPLAPRPVAPGTIADLFDPAAAPTRRPSAPKASPRAAPKAEPEAPKPRDFGPVAELRYEAGPCEGEAGDATAAGPFEPWRARTLRIAGAMAHPTPLVQSGAMAAVPHPWPAYRPMLPERVVAEGLLSDAQLESVVLAGQAHDGHLSALYRIGEGWETVRRVDGEHERPVDAGPGDANERLSAPVRLRKGWMLGDGTGCGNGRQVSAIILDQWLRGRRRALWLSQSDKLLEDARRDWTALGGAEGDVIPLAKVRQGAEIPQAEGILFATYATLRSPARQGKRSRLEQVVGWLAGGLDEVERRLPRRRRLRRGARDGERGGVEGQPRRGRPLAAGMRGPAPPERPSRRAHHLHLRDRRHDGAGPCVREAPGPLGLGRDPLRDPLRFHRHDGGGRRRRDGGGREGLEGPRVLPGPRALLRRRGGRHPRAPADARTAAHLRRLRGRVLRSSTPTSRRRSRRPASSRGTRRSTATPSPPPTPRSRARSRDSSGIC